MTCYLCYKVNIFVLTAFSLFLNYSLTLKFEANV